MISHKVAHLVLITTICGGHQDHHIASVGLEGNGNRGKYTDTHASYCAVSNKALCL